MELDKQLGKTTHFVVLLTEGYELSPVCTYEIEEILKRTEVKILPFMAGGRSVPHPKLGALHHRLLNATDTAGSAEVVVQQVMETLGSVHELRRMRKAATRWRVPQKVLASLS